MTRLKVLLIKPYSRADEMIPPLGLGYLATAIRNHHEVEIIDGLKEKLTPDKFRQMLIAKTPDICCFQVFTFQIPIVAEYLTMGRQILPGVKFILGGPHPSASPDDIFTLFPEADYAFKGEAELGLAQLLDLLATEQTNELNLTAVPGLIWINADKTAEEKNADKTAEKLNRFSILKRDNFANNQTIVNRQNFHCDLDGLGLPAWDLLAPDTYPIAPHGAFFKHYPVAPIIITRGCPFSCTYCSGHLTSGKKIRFRSAADVMTEVKLLYEQYGIREIHIEDDNFTFNRQLVLDFCRALKANNLNISWTCPNGVRLDTLDEELLLTMKDAGLYSLSVGIESGSDKILRDIKKSLTTAVIREKINLIKQCGLEVTGFFIIGYPTETKDDILATIKFACELPLKRASFALFKPFPGTEITNTLIARGEISPKNHTDWAKYILADAVYAPPGFTTAQMKQLRRRAILSFYLRPKIMWQFISEIKNLKHLKLIIKRAISWLFKAK
jgi:radical SAM superfamily enzyme YgiQ (UPF0313 family)